MDEQVTCSEISKPLSYFYRHYREANPILEQTKLILSKNGTVTPEDKQAARDLVNLITSPSISLHDMYPCLFSRCRMRIDKRLRRAHESFCSNIVVIE